jgi:hypothetical protein
MPFNVLVLKSEWDVMVDSYDQFRPWMHTQIKTVAATAILQNCL